MNLNLVIGAIIGVIALIDGKLAGSPGDSALMILPGENVKDLTTTNPGQADIFEPTDEWQEIGSTQQLPGGLWIRMNLATGKKEARNLPK